MRALRLALLAALLPNAVRAQPVAELPRRTYLGASLAPVPDSLRVSGARVLAVLPGTPAERSGVHAGDVITEVGGRAVADVSAVLAALRPLRAGETERLTVWRDGASRAVAFTAAERPRETPPDLDVRYATVATPGGRRRVLVTRPRDAVRHPAVLVVGGVGCYSIDVSSGESAYRDLSYHLARRGFVVFRVEKSGVGDSVGAPCATVDFENELSGYAAALDAMRRDPAIDPARIFLFGHSIGGIAAPTIVGRDTARVPVRGIALLSVVGIAWYEYELPNLRRQLRMQHLPPDSIERDMRLKTTCMFHLLLEREARTALLARQPECAPHIAYPASDAYMQQVAAVDQAALWKPVAVPTLVMYGTSDFITDRDEHVELVERIDALHPGMGTFAEVPELDHYLSHEPSREASLTDPTPGLARRYYGATLEPILDAWLARLSG